MYARQNRVRVMHPAAVQLFCPRVGHRRWWTVIMHTNNTERSNKQTLILHQQSLHIYHRRHSRCKTTSSMSAEIHQENKEQRTPAETHKRSESDDGHPAILHSTHTHTLTPTKPLNHTLYTHHLKSIGTQNYQHPGNSVNKNTLYQSGNWLVLYSPISMW